jgi:hypothetical protein
VNGIANLKDQIEGDESEITKVLEEKLGRGMPKDIRTSLISLEILRSLGELANGLGKGDVWTKGLVEKGLAYLRSEEWKTQKAGVAILSALAQTSRRNINRIIRRASFDPLFQNMAWTPSCHTYRT